MDSKSSFSDLGQEFKDDMNIDPEVASINSPIYTPSHYHSPTYTTRVLLETPPPPTVSRPPLDRFATTRKSPTHLPTQERPPLDRFATKRKSPTYLPPPPPEPDRFATTSPSSLSSLPLLPPPMDHLTVTSPSEDTTKQNTKKTGGRTKTLPLTQYGGSPQDDFFDAIQQLLDGNLLTDLEKLIGVFIAKPPIDINAENNNGQTALAMLVRGIPRHSIPIKKCAKIAQIRVKLVKLLLENGALIGYGPGGRANLVRIVKRYGSKPLRCIENDLDSARWNTEIEHVRLKMADLLLMHGSVNRPMGSSRWTPLFYAVWSLDVPYVKLLLKRGANVQAKDRDGKTPLMLLRSINVGSWLLPGDPISHHTSDGRRLVQSTIYEIESILLKHYAKRNTKQRLVDQMGPPNMKDLQETAELPRGSRIQAEPDDYPIEDGDGMLRKKIKSYLGGKKTRRLRRYNKRTLTKDKQDEEDEEELDEMECIARYPYNDESAERMKDCLKN